MAQLFLQRLNEYLFQTHEGLGSTVVLEGEEVRYFSQFHKYWEAHHKEIIAAKTNPQRARLAAEALAQAIRRQGPGPLDLPREAEGLAPEAIAKARFFTANQDFRRPPPNPFKTYLADPSAFDPEEIKADPARFLRIIGVTDLSQTEKRLDFARNAAQFVVSQGIEPHKLAEIASNDAGRLRELLVGVPNMGYGCKKADMFIRDMFCFGVWPDLANLDRVNVASDRNTMKVALRTGVLQTQTPLLSSFLDIFCYQYGYIDEASASAWRSVWEHWSEISPETAPKAPCLMDFLLYRIGRDYCDEILSRYQCSSIMSHSFYYFQRRLRTCLECRKVSRKAAARPVQDLLPCQTDPERLPREGGRLMLAANNLFYELGGVCVFDSVCQPRSAEFRKLSPPRSISIRGRTSWTESYAYRDEGGGGMMS